MYLPTFENELLMDVIESYRKRSKAFRHTHGVRYSNEGRFAKSSISIDKVWDDIDGYKLEMLDIQINYHDLRWALKIWEDRYLHFNVAEYCKADDRFWKWNCEGRLMGGCNGRDLIAALEKSLFVSRIAGFDDSVQSAHDSLSGIWRPIVAQGPKEVPSKA